MRQTLQDTSWRWYTGLFKSDHSDVRGIEGYKVVCNSLIRRVQPPVATFSGIFLCAHCVKLHQEQPRASFASAFSPQEVTDGAHSQHNGGNVHLSEVLANTFCLICSNQASLSATARFPLSRKLSLFTVVNVDGMFSKRGQHTTPLPPFNALCPP